MLAHAGNSSDGFRKAKKSANGEKNAQKACFTMKMVTNQTVFGFLMQAV